MSEQLVLVACGAEPYRTCEDHKPNIKYSQNLITNLKIEPGKNVTN